MSDQPTETSSRTAPIVIGLLIAVHLGLGIHTAFRKTVTHDEIWHLPVGILNWQTGQFHHDDLNPPLTRMWSALPAWLLGPDVAEGQDGSDIATRYVVDHANYRTWYIWGRILNLMCSVGTILIAVKWSREWFGDTAAILTALLCCTEPTLLAHSSLVTPDAGLMLTFTAALYLVGRWRDQPTWKLAGLLGLVLGLAQATKFTALVLYPIILFAGILVMIRPRSRDVSFRQMAVQLAVAIVISLVVWNAAFLFRGTGRAVGSYEFQSESMKSIQQAVMAVGDVPVLLPESYMTGLDRQRFVMEQPHPVFLDLQWSLAGFPSYFLKSVQYKLSHALQLIVGLGILVALFQRQRRRADMMVLLAVPIVLLTGIASLSSMQLGVRYVLPLLPCLILFTGPLAQSLSRRPAGVRIGVAVAVGVALLLPLRHHPHHLAYFNELAGGPVGGRLHLLDSNLDWGQDLHLVREFMADEGLDEIGLLYFGTIPPYADGIRYHTPPVVPQRGWYAISVNFVMGRPHQIREADGGYRLVNVNEFAWFRQYKPVATLGGSIDIYHIER